DRNRSHWSTSKTPSYTKSVSWQHHRPPVLNEEQKQVVFERIKSGVSISAIAREFKTSRQTILRAKAKLQTPDI
ncbi:helix-turn-helix domain-containing protein, partial [Escherichia coli]|uniref:helix-turn-helix domain-containing protein n=1 Tax=Escherichia coli TaxID=562 RepID=UPI0020194781